MLDINPSPQLNIQNVQEAMPKQVQQKPKNVFMETGEENTKLIGIFTIIVFIIILIVAGALYFLKSQKTSQLATKNTKVEELQAKLKTPDLAAIDEEVTRYSLGLKELSGFMASSPQYSILIKSLSSLTPNEIKLTNFSVDAKNAVKIAGQSLDNSQISLFIDSLQNSGEFSNIILDKNQFTQDTGSGGGNNYSFSLSATLTPKTLLRSKK